MMKSLREVNADVYVVGWYQSVYLGGYLTESLIETQYTYQAAIKKSVVLVYDPAKSTSSGLALKAYRLTPEFMALFKDSAFTREKSVQPLTTRLSESSLKASQVFEEIPIRLHNTHVVSGYLSTLARPPKFDSIELPSTGVLEKNLDLLRFDCLLTSPGTLWTSW